MKMSGTEEDLEVSVTYGPHQVRSAFETCTKYAGSDHSAHAQSIICRYFSSVILEQLGILSVGSEDRNILAD